MTHNEQHEKYFFNSKPEQKPEQTIDVKILEKGLKLKRASELGDNREFAFKKYNEFLMDNSLSSSQILEFEKQDIKKQPEQLIKKSVIVLGVEFSSMKEFIEYYDKLSFVDKSKIMVQILFGKFKK